MRMQLFMSLFFIAGLTACIVPPEKRVATPEVVAELESRKIIRLTDAEIVSGTQEIANEIATYITKNTDSLSCGTVSVQLPDSLTKIPEALTVRCDTTAADLHPKEKAVLQAYFGGAAAGVPLEDNIQSFRDTEKLLFTRPLYIQDSLFGMLSVLVTRGNAIAEIGHRIQEEKKRKRYR